MGKDEPLAPTPRARGGHVDRRAIGGPMTMHAGLASGRWRTLTLAEQLANAGADIGRAIRARLEGDQVRFDAALDRALELLDLTLADPRWKGPRLREIARTREVVCDFLVGDNLYRSTPELLDAYFLAFGVAARRDR